MFRVYMNSCVYARAHVHVSKSTTNYYYYFDGAVAQIKPWPPRCTCKLYTNMRDLKFNVDFLNG